MNGTWSSVDVAGKSVEVYDPPGPDAPRFGVLYLHGAALETLRDRPAFTHLFDRFRLACVCPPGGPCWWADRVCAEFDPVVTPERHVLDRVLLLFQERWRLGPRAVGLLGIGMGGQGALRLAFKYPERFPVVAALAPAIEYHELYGQGLPLDDLYDSKEQCRQDTAPMHVHPGRFPAHIFFCMSPGDAAWLRGCDRLHEKLSALGVPHEIDFTTRAGGPPGDYFDHLADRAVRFVQAGLEQESRRLL
jgi:S-formylglutathione hydrolase